jgi:hypothetical protein
MNDIAVAIAHVINDWGWLIIIGLVTGGGDVVGRMVDGRRKRAALKATLDAAKAENARLNNQLTAATQTLGGSTDGTDVAGLIAQARTAMDDRAELMDVLAQVLATDNAVPQLPAQLHTDIAEVLGRYRARLANREVDAPAALTAGKAAAKAKRT